MLSAKERRLLDALEPHAIAAGLELVSVEVAGSKKAPCVRIYLDAEGGISFDALAASQTWVNQVVEDIDPFPGAYTLEVSSPGIDRPLRTPEHFATYVGSKATVKTRERIANKNSHTGIIESSDDEGIVLRCEGGEVAIPYAAMRRANLIGEIDFNR